MASALSGMLRMQGLVYAQVTALTQHLEVRDLSAWRITSAQMGCREDNTPMRPDGWAILLLNTPSRARMRTVQTTFTGTLALPLSATEHFSADLFPIRWILLAIPGHR
jgi:hypothetical protein